ncbi:sensor histidine kinase KdpD [Streptomyces sp. HPF1205]|uniref:sensor histidine kinase n=1 Tax=Streptomyces sp. HPF1205 TaxID=2873262 RepID=UPI001CEDF6A0|nr:ATP-binding protein [Streptomyces sp. HPF1205]
MSAQDSPLAFAPLPPPHRKTSAGKAAVLPLAVTVAAGAACAWTAATRTSTEDRPVVLITGGIAAALLGVALALGLSRRRLGREMRHRTEWLHAEAARTIADHAEAVRRAAAELEAAQRVAREAEVRRRTSVEAEVSLRAALKAETARAAALEGETARLAEVTVPLAVDRLRAGGSADTVLSRLPRPSGPAHQRLLDVVVRELGAGERMRAAGTTACANAASRLQALSTAMLADLREMEQRHGEEVLGDLLHLDHCTAQAGRLADSIAVLTGARTGRRWTKPIVMESVLRGAMGRINAYHRVRLHSVSTAAVAGHAAEGVMHALAELMDNACNFSPPTEDVHVYVQETHSGVVVTIEDAGLVMPDAALARAEKLVSADPLDLRTLPGTRLGLAVVGCLARKHGLLVSFRPSSRGGTGVVVLIPPKIVTQAPEDPSGAVLVQPPPAPDFGADFASDFAVPERHDPAPYGYPAPAAGPTAPLPKRTRGRTLAASHRGDLSADPDAAWLDPSPEEEERAARARAAAGARFSAFREAAAGRAQARAGDGDAHSGERTGEHAPADFTATGEGPTAGEAWDR